MPVTQRSRPTPAAPAPTAAPVALAAPAPAAPAGEPAGLPARRLAWDVVGEVLRSRAALDEVFDARAAEAALSPRDASLARAIATVTFRHLGTIRAALAERLAQGLPSDQRLVTLLVIGAAQILFLDVPDRAAVDTAVRLAQGERRLLPLAGLVNAVLRRLARERDAVGKGVDPLRVNTPGWLAERWIRRYGEDTARAVAAAHARAAAIDLTVKGDPHAWAERLDGIVLPTGSVRLTRRTAIADLPGYDEGGWWVQDAAAALPARLLDVRPGERVADLCAAPGGKTAQLASAGATVVAVDRSGRRLRRLGDNMARLGLPVEAVAADALALDPTNPFDAVLVDAPCSATGTIRRHPDVAWTKREADVAALAGLQARLLDKAASLLRPGGRLVYCTCSLEPEEGEDQAAAFLARHPDFARKAVQADEIGGIGPFVTEAGDLRTLPCSAIGDDGGLDGFFAARFVRQC